VAIANELQLGATLRRASLPHPLYITTPCQVWSRSTYLLRIIAFLLLIHYITQEPWPLTF